MEHHPTWIGDLVNQWLGALVLPLLEAIGVHPHEPARPIPDHIATEWFIAVLAVIFFLWFRSRLSADNPGGLQLCAEQLLSNSFRVGLYDLLDEIVGPHGRQHLALVGSVGLFVLFCNSISLIPGFVSPTSNVNVPAGCAIVVFLYYQYQGMKKRTPNNDANEPSAAEVLTAFASLAGVIAAHRSRKDPGRRGNKHVSRQPSNPDRRKGPAEGPGELSQDH